MEVSLKKPRLVSWLLQNEDDEKEKIYIVEDDEMIVQLLKRHLGKSYLVESVQNFRAVSQEVAIIKPDLVLMDISYPITMDFTGRLKCVKP